MQNGHLAMIDFTKEELLGLLYMVITFIRECEGSKKADEMKDKIQSMIDNYCEHESNIMSTKVFV